MMIESIVIAALATYSIYWVANYSSFLEAVQLHTPQSWLNSLRSLTPVSCSFCFAFWLTLIRVAAWQVDPIQLVTVPVLCMFLHLIYSRLTK